MTVKDIADETGLSIKTARGIMTRQSIKAFKSDVNDPEKGKWLCKRENFEAYMGRAMQRGSTAYGMAHSAESGPKFIPNEEYSFLLQLVPQDELEEILDAYEEKHK